MLLGPITGWIIVSTARLTVPTILFGVVPWPHLPLPGSLAEPMEAVHEALAWIAIALFVLHVLGALRHQFMLRDPVIKRMSPGGSVAAAIVLLIATVAVYFGVGSYVSQKYLLPALRAAVRALRAGRANPPLPRRRPLRGRSCSGAGADRDRDRTSGRPAPGVDDHRRKEARLLGRQRRHHGERELQGLERHDRDGPGPSAERRYSHDHQACQRVGRRRDPERDAARRRLLCQLGRSGRHWRSAKVTETGSGHYRASGTLTIKGKSRPQAIAFALSGDGLRAM